MLDTLRYVRSEEPLERVGVLELQPCGYAYSVSLLSEPTRCVALSVSGEALGRQSSLNTDIYRGLTSH